MVVGMVMTLFSISKNGDRWRSRTSDLYDVNVTL